MSEDAVNLDGVPYVAPSLKVHEAMARVQASIEAIAKTVKQGAGLKFAFRGVDEVVNAVQPALIEHKVTVRSTDIDIISRDNLATASGKATWSVVIKVSWEFVGPGGDTMQAVSLGESQDWSDKGIAQAYSVAQRELLVKTFSIPTEAAFEREEREERAAPFSMRGPAAPTKKHRSPAQLRKAIRECTSEMELNAVGAEINDNPKIQKGGDDHRDIGAEWKEMKLFLSDAPPPTSVEDEAAWMKDGETK